MNELILKNNWKLYPSDKLEIDGSEISSPDFCDAEWYSANVPSTVLSTLVDNNIYIDPYYGTNLKDIPTQQFSQPWFYRNEFKLKDFKSENIVLINFKGINYKANIWLNGQSIANEKIVKGAFRQFTFDISDKIKLGTNILVVEVIPPKNGDFSVGFVDWNPNPPDKNMGIFRDVILEFNNGISINKPFVESKVDIGTLTKAELMISAELENHTDTLINGVLTGSIGEIIFSKKVRVNSLEKKTIIFNTDEFSQLGINNPRLWWPNQLGEQYLYNLKLSLTKEGEIIDESSTNFGIRQIEDYVNDGGHRGFKINGHKVLIRGAGWTDDLFLGDTHESLKAQIKYVKDMNLNCIRLEGFWGKDHKLYDLCDEYGILIMVGWSCQWEHEEYLGKPVDKRFGGVIEPDEINLIAKSWEDQVLWLRNHPSIFVWTVGSDLLPHPDLERKYVETFKKYDSTRPYLNSTGGIGSEQGIISSTEIISEISGSSRVKMLGPYAYTPPIYWYTNKNLGGAYGFNTETCPGANIPPIESLLRTIPKESLWPVNEIWNFHCGKNSFSSIDRIKKAIEKRYGKSNNVRDFVFKAQILNYELMRPMFEAFQANQSNATGIIQWMLNSSWPEMYWQLYDSFLMPNGSYFGAKKANEVIHLLYNYGCNSIVVINNTLEIIENYTAVIKIFDINSNQIFEKSIMINLEGEASIDLITLPDLPEITSVYFLDLRLIDNTDKEIGNNFYWLSTKQDVLDYETKLEGWAYHTPSKVYSDFTQLMILPKIRLDIKYDIQVEKHNNNITVYIHNNNDTIAFFVELLLFDKNTDKVILPVLWSDNYISLLPNEKRKIEAQFSDFSKATPDLRLKGWNLL